MSNSMAMGMRVKLSAMMFLQFMMLPVWFIPMFGYVERLKDGAQWAGWCALLMGLGTLTSPMLGMFADRFMNSERVLAICNFAGAALLAWAYTIQDPRLLFFVLLATMLFYMPTWSLTATIAMSNSTTEAFPQIRVFGSLGWVASAIFSVVGVQVFGIENFDKTSYIFLGGAIASVLGGFLAFFLPPTPPKAKGTPMSVVDALGLRALTLFKNREFATFGILILLAMIPFNWYMAYNGAYLGDKGFKYITLTSNLGQVFELAFMLMIPLLLRKVGYKWAIVIGLGALVVRYSGFYLGATQGWLAGDMTGIFVHGLVFGLLIVGSQMYVDAKAPANLRAQAQGLIGIITFGVGAILSNKIFEVLLGYFSTKNAEGVMVRDWSKPYLIALIMSVVLMVAMAIFFPKAKEEQK
jgi:nucleoside transporter